MSFGNGFHERARRAPGLLSFLLMGLLGVVFGALLAYGLFIYYGLPEAPGLLLDPEAGSGDAAAPPPHQQDLATVEVVNSVMPAVVGVNRYVYVSRFGQQALVESGTGSGVVITADGFIVTNQHVVGGAAKIVVVFPDSDRYEARLVGEDALTDLALLKIDRSRLPYIPLGDSSRLRVGETVLAIGNPLGFFQQTVTAGIISAVERQVRIPDSQYAHTYIQTDAGINRGNSGGPLVNLRGEAIGINTLKVVQPDVEGIGFSIPSNTVKRVVGDLMEHGRVLRPMLGVVPTDLSQYTGDTTDRGVLIREIVPGSAAERNGLLPGDVIIAVGEKEINYLAQLFDALLEYYPGDRVSITVRRNGQLLNLTAVLGEM